MTTTTIGVSTEVPSEPAPIDLTALTPVRGDPVDPVTGRSASELAHDVAVVFETLNVEAEGYPALEELVTPELLAKLEPMGMIEPYHGNGCWQIVTSINLVQMASEYQLFAFDLEPEMRCPDSNAEDPYGILPPGSQGMVRVEVAISSDPNGRLIVTGVRQA